MTKADICALEELPFDRHRTLYQKIMFGIRKKI